MIRGPCTKPALCRERGGKLKGSLCPGSGRSREQDEKHRGSLQLAFCSRQTEEPLQRHEAQFDTKQWRLFSKLMQTNDPPNWPPSSQPCTVLKSQRERSLGEMAGDFPSGEPVFSQAVTAGITVLRCGGNVPFSILFWGRGAPQTGSFVLQKETHPQILPYFSKHI